MASEIKSMPAEISQADESRGITLLDLAEGLWVARLGSPNLFDAMLPEAVATFDGAKAISQATKFSRWIYFLILAACAICAVVIAFTTDVRLVLNSSAIPLSRVSNAVP